MLGEALLLAHCYIQYSDKRCTIDHEDPYAYTYDDEEEEDLPKPPEIGHSYIAKYEMNSFHAKHSAWVEEYFDFQGKRAKISASVLGMEFVDIYDYGRGTVTSYRLQRPEKSGWSSKIEETCKTVEMADFKPAFQVLSYPVTKGTKRGPQTMATSNRAFKYGPPYNYTFKDDHIGVETRNIPSDVFRGCVDDQYSNYSLRSDFYWGRALSFSYPSGEERIPVFIEMRGPDVHNTGKEVYIKKYVPWFQNNPEFAPEMFEIPKGLHCEYLPRRARLPNIPDSFSYSVEETEFLLDESGFLKGGFRSSSYKEVWYDRESELARIDMRPTAQDLKALDVEDTYEYISILFDLKSGLTYLSDMATSECLLTKNDTTYFWKYGNGTIKSSEELFGISSSLQYKGKTIIMGVEAETWTDLMKDPDQCTITKRELSFSSHKKRKDPYTNKYLFSFLQESTYKEKCKQEQAAREFTIQDVIVKNYLEFNSHAPEQHVFGQHACIPEEPTGSYYINFKPVKKCALDAGNKTRFLTVFRKNLSGAVGLSTILSLQTFHFRWIKQDELSVGFSFHGGIPGEKTNETSFTALAKQEVASPKKPITVSFRLRAASESDDCSWRIETCVSRALHMHASQVVQANGTK
ncbi:hypothetical protein V5799_022736 [Amblyomma americanum]|uniref:LolA-like domain-containing protein n=1 Tax=Amblyomma americanum TaxID=6943 RepID=A0AAQ4FLN8_AMBAM